MTPEVEDPLLDHFVHVILDNVIVYEYQMGLTVMEVNEVMQQFVEEDVDSLSLVDSQHCLGEELYLFHKLLKDWLCEG